MFYPCQVIVVRWTVQMLNSPLRGALLAYDVSLGKTIVCIVLMLLRYNLPQGLNSLGEYKLGPSKRSTRVDSPSVAAHSGQQSTRSDKDADGATDTSPTDLTVSTQSLSSSCLPALSPFRCQRKYSQKFID